MNLSFHNCLFLEVPHKLNHCYYPFLFNSSTSFNIEDYYNFSGNETAKDQTTYYFLNGIPFLAWPNQWSVSNGRSFIGLVYVPLGIIICTWKPFRQLIRECARRSAGSSVNCPLKES